MKKIARFKKKQYLCIVIKKQKQIKIKKNMKQFTFTFTAIQLLAVALVCSCLWGGYSAYAIHRDAVRFENLKNRYKQVVSELDDAETALTKMRETCPNHRDYLLKEIKSY